MIFTSWWRNRKAASNRGRRTTRCPLRLEALEDRCVPSTFNVTTPVDEVNPNDGVLSLREAVIQANATSGANTIVVPAGTYTLTRVGAGEDAALTGDLVLTSHVTIQGAGAGATVVDAAGIDRVFQVLADGNATLSGMTIRGGSESLAAC
jgi:hypothetical protein